jgi:hypothetical protein
MKRFRVYHVFGVVLVLNLVYILAGVVFHWPDRLFLGFWFIWCFGAYIAECEIGLQQLPMRTFLILSTISFVIAMTAEVWFKRLNKSEEFIGATSFIFLALPMGLCLYGIITHGHWRFWNSTTARLFAGVGMFSYSLYAVHKSFLICYRAVIFGGNKSPYFLDMLFPLLLAIGLGWLVFQFVERWTIRSKKPGQ